MQKSQSNADEITAVEVVKVITGALFCASGFYVAYVVTCIW